MSSPGPELAALTRRLAETPPEFLLEPDAVNVAAVAADVLRTLSGAALRPADLRALQAVNAAARPEQRLILLAGWLLAEPAFGPGAALAEPARRLLLEGMKPLAGVVTVQQCVTDPERREEFARHCLHALDLRPAGESEAEAADRRLTVSSLERRRVVAAARQAEARARAVREAMARQAAYDAQMKAMRE